MPAPAWLRASLPALLLGGCASLSEQECRTIDWLRLGERDGAAGHAPSRLDAHRQACAEHGLGSDDGPWNDGYQLGLLRYCDAPNGWRVGRRGGGYEGVCPASLEPAFLAHYDWGRQAHALDRDLESLRGDIERRLQVLQRSEDRPSESQRRQLRYELDRLYDEHHHLQRRLERLEHDYRSGRLMPP